MYYEEHSKNPDESPQTFFDSSPSNENHVERKAHYMRSFSISAANQDGCINSLHQQMAGFHAFVVPSSPDVFIRISMDGVDVWDTKRETQLMSHALRRISYVTCCGHTNLFAFLSRYPRKHSSRQVGHVFRTNTSGQAEELSRTLGAAFKFLDFLQDHQQQLQCQSATPTTHTPTKEPSFLQFLAQQLEEYRINSSSGSSLSAMGIPVTPSVHSSSSPILSPGHVHVVYDSIPTTLHLPPHDSRTPSTGVTPSSGTNTSSMSQSSIDELITTHSGSSHNQTDSCSNPLLFSSPSSMDDLAEMAARDEEAARVTCPVLQNVRSYSKALAIRSQHSASASSAPRPHRTGVCYQNNGFEPSASSSSSPGASNSNHHPPGYHQVISDAHVNKQQHGNVSELERVDQLSGRKYRGLSHSGELQAVSYSGSGDEWYRPDVTREAAMRYLLDKASGSFLIRASSSHQGDLVLTLRTTSSSRNTPGINGQSKFSHFLIQHSLSAKFRLQGLDKEWPSLESMVTHLSVLPEILPCPLRLPPRGRRSGDPPHSTPQKEFSPPALRYSSRRTLLSPFPLHESRKFSLPTTTTLHPLFQTQATSSFGKEEQDSMDRLCGDYEKLSDFSGILSKLEPSHNSEDGGPSS